MSSPSADLAACSSSLTARCSGAGLEGLTPSADLRAGPLTSHDVPAWRSLLETPVPKQRYAGTYRTCPPAETWRRVQPHLAAMGITRVANVTGLDRVGVPVVMVCRPNARSLATSQGKGLDFETARISGVMECIELHHAERIHQPLLLASAAEMRALHPLVDLDGIPRITVSRFHEHLQLLWIEGFDLLTAQPRWLPFETVHASAASPAPTGSGCFAATSNGLASGNHLLEAIVHGLLEVIERDATAVWGAHGEGVRESTAVDLETVDDAACRWVLDRCRQAGLRVAAFETTSDLGIPAFLCEVSDAYGADASELVFSGLGCHLRREVALLRALTEAVQSRLTLIAGSRDDLAPRDYLGTPASRLSLTPRRSFLEAPDLGQRATFNEDLELLLERLQESGVEQVLAVDLTRAEFGIPVARVVVPRLEGPDDDPEYVPGPRARAARP